MGATNKEREEAEETISVTNWGRLALDLAGDSPADFFCERVVPLPGKDK